MRPPLSLLCRVVTPGGRGWSSEDTGVHDPSRSFSGVLQVLGWGLGRLYHGMYRFPLIPTSTSINDSSTGSSGPISASRKVSSSPSVFSSRLTTLHSSWCSSSAPAPLHPLGSRPFPFAPHLQRDLEGPPYARTVVGLKLVRSGESMKIEILKFCHLNRTKFGVVIL